MPPRGRKRKNAGENSDAGDSTPRRAGGAGEDADLSAAVSSLSTAFPFASPAGSVAGAAGAGIAGAGAGAGATGATGAGAATTGAFVKRSQLSAREKLAVVEWYHANGKNQQATSAHFKALPGYEKLSQSTVSRWIAGEAKIRELVDSGRANVVRLNSVRHPDFENVLKAWLDRMDGTDVTHLTGDLIKQTASKVYDHLQIPAEQRLELSNGWLRSFQTRQGIKVGKPRRSIGPDFASSDNEQSAHELATFRNVVITVPDAVIKREQERIATTIREFLSWDHKRSLRDVWNFDEIPLCYAFSPDRDASAGPGAADHARKQSFTLALAANADGSERKQPLIIGKAERPSSFKKGRTGPQLGFQYLHNRGGWMTAEIFYAWLDLWNTELLSQNRYVLVLVDSFSGHKLGKKEFSNIQLEYFSPRVTEIVQPFCDLAGGIARAFKACFRQLIVLRAADRLLVDDTVAENERNERIFEIDQLAAMELASRAWPLVQGETIWRCWRNAKILPMDQSSSRTDVRPGILVLPELQTLQEALFVLREEARIKGTWLDLMDALAFVDGDLDDAAGHDARLEEIVQFTVGARDRNAGVRGADGNPVAGILNEVDESASNANGNSNEAAADTDIGAADLPPVEVYKSLLVLEQYWRENALHVSEPMRELLQSTRKHLQADINEARQQQNHPRVQQPNQQRPRARRK